jgi:hypothetical protein
MFYNRHTAQTILDLIASGKSHTDILYFLVSRGIPSFSSLPWTVTSVANAIRSVQDPSFRPNSIAAKNFKEISREAENQKG